MAASDTHLRRNGCRACVTGSRRHHNDQLAEHLRAPCVPPGRRELLGSDPRSCGQEPGHPVAGSRDPPAGCSRCVGVGPDATAPHDALGAGVLRTAGAECADDSEHPDGMVELPLPDLLIERCSPGLEPTTGHLPVTESLTIADGLLSVLAR